MSHGTITIFREVATSFPELSHERSRPSTSEEISDNSPLLRVVEKWLRDDYKRVEDAKIVKMVDGRLIKL